MSKKNNTEVSVVSEEPKTFSSEELVVADVGGELVSVDFFEDAGSGLEDMGAGDLAMPFLALLQKMSPQVDDTNGKYVEGARAGMIHNTLTNEVLDGKNGIRCIPCGYKKMFTAWTPRDQGGGFKGHHDADSPIVKNAKQNEQGRLVAANGDWLIDTAYYFLLVEIGGHWQQVMLSMTSTQLKKSRRWNSMMSGLRMTATRGGKPVSFNPPMFSHIYKMKTIPESNDKGSWYGWDVSIIGPVNDGALYIQAKDFHTKVVAGQVQAGPPPAEGGESSGEEVPF